MIKKLKYTILLILISTCTLMAIQSFSFAKGSLKIMNQSENVIIHVELSSSENASWEGKNRIGKEGIKKWETCTIDNIIPGTYDILFKSTEKRKKVIKSNITIENDKETFVIITSRDWD